jgi:hypothetical protein
MKLVYQIGDVPLFGSIVASDGDVSLSEDRSWETKETAFTGTGGTFNHLPVGRRLPERVTVSIEGSLTSSQAQSYLHTLSRMKSKGGLRDVVLIALEVYATGSANTVRWLQTKGTITDVKDMSEYGEDVDGFYQKKLSIQMNVDPTWYPLMNWYWEYRPIRTYVPPIFANELAQAGVDNIFAQPKTFGAIDNKNYFQSWPDTYSALAPSAWGYMYQNGGGFGYDYRPFQTFYFNSEEKQWSAPPIAKYALKSLLPQGTITVETTSSETVHTATLDLASMDLQLTNSGFDGLQPGDEVFFGNVDPFCSFVRRNDVLLAEFVPQWEYTGLYPGEVATGYNKVRIYGTNTTGKFAVNIKYGSY